MSYNREAWEEVSFQVFEDENGDIRSGYYPTGAGIVTGNIAIDFAHGKYPIQPNEDREYEWQRLGPGNSHKIAAVEWNSYPQIANSRNYMVTGAEYLGGVLYEYTSQNNLKVGDYVRTTNCPGYNGTAYVVYADANKFRTENELPGTEKLTGLYGRVDVMDNDTGSSLEGGDAFYWPNLWVCDNQLVDRKLSSVINEFVSYGVPRDYFVDFTFSGGETEWDAEGTPNYDGAIFYTYIPATVFIGTDWLNRPIYGSDWDGLVIGGNQNGGYEDSVDTGYPEDYALFVVSNDPRKDNAWWWF